MAKHVLIIEDEPHIVEAMSFIFERDGWRVTHHKEGATAVDRITSSDPDVVILDVMLPGQNGFEILRGLRQRAGYGALPVVILTAKGQARDRVEALEAGATTFMTKPFSNHELLNTVNALLGEEAGR